MSQQGAAAPNELELHMCLNLAASSVRRSILNRNDAEETTNEHQWTRIRCSGSGVGREALISLFGEHCRGRPKAGKRRSLFVWIRVHSWLNCMNSV